MYGGALIVHVRICLPNEVWLNIYFSDFFSLSFPCSDINMTDLHINIILKKVDFIH